MSVFQRYLDKAFALAETELRKISRRLYEAISICTMLLHVLTASLAPSSALLAVKKNTFYKVGLQNFTNFIFAKLHAQLQTVHYSMPYANAEWSLSAVVSAGGS